MCAKLWAPNTPPGLAHKASIVGVWLLAHHQPDRSCCSDKARKAHPEFVQMPLPHPYQAEGRELAKLMLIQRKKERNISNHGKSQFRQLGWGSKELVWPAGVFILSSWRQRLDSQEWLVGGGRGLLVRPALYWVQKPGTCTLLSRT